MTDGPLRVFWHPACLEHDGGRGHPESLDRLRAIRRALLEARGGGRLDPDTVMNARSLEAARHAAGAAVSALAGFTLEPEDYATWVTRWRALGAPIASVLEGGDVPVRIVRGAEAHLSAL